MLLMVCLAVQKYGMAMVSCKNERVRILGFFMQLIVFYKDPKINELIKNKGDAVIDGEVVVFRGGMPSFPVIQNYKGK